MSTPTTMAKSIAPLDTARYACRKAAPPDADEAEVRYREAFALAQELEMRPLQAHCHLGLGTLCAAIGRRAEARAELSTAVELYRSMEMTFWLAKAEVVIAEGTAS